jgi:hypothetical protein
MSIWDKLFPWACQSVRLAYGERETDVSVLRIPGYRQCDPASCGYAAGMMALRYFYPRRSDEAFWKKFPRLEHEDPDKRLTPQGTLVRALRNSGVGVTVSNRLTFDKIMKYIEKGFPIITTIYNGNHWVVIYGYGLTPRRLYIAGNGAMATFPVLGKIFCDTIVPTWGEFYQTWKGRYSRGQGLVCRRLK